MRNKSILFVFLLFIVLTITGCGINKVPDEGALKEMLIEKYPECLQRYIYQEENFEIDSFEIIRRQTNKEEKTDKVDCKLVVHNENYEGIFNYTLYLNYYSEGGWQLDDFEKLDDEEVKAKKNTLPAELKEYEIDNYINYYGNISFVDELFDTETGIITRKYTADNKFNYLNVSGNLEIQYVLREENIEGILSYCWVPEYFDGINLNWNLKRTYKLNVKDKEWWEGDYPQIYGCEKEGENYRTEIEELNITNLTNDKIEVNLEMLVLYSGTKYRREYSEKIEFDSKCKHFSRNVLSNRDGDYLKLIFDADRGIYLEYYNFDDNSISEYEFIPF